MTLNLTFIKLTFDYIWLLLITLIDLPCLDMSWQLADLQSHLYPAKQSPPCFVELLWNHFLRGCCCTFRWWTWQHFATASEKCACTSSRYWSPRSGLNTTSPRQTLKRWLFSQNVGACWWEPPGQDDPSYFSPEHFDGRDWIVRSSPISKKYAYMPSVEKCKNI